MSRTKKILISSFIMFSFLAMFRVHLPMKYSFIRSVYAPVDPVLSFFSIYQSWNMFSPNPSKTNSFIVAEVEFDDGSKDRYDFPKASEMNLIEKYNNGERFRVITNVITNDQNRFLWRDAAKFALRKMKDKNFYKIPMKVHLIRHWSVIPEVEKEFLPHLSKSTNYNIHKFFTYEVL